MRVHVVSDVHGNAEALARASAGADAVVVLGDLLDIVDYHDHERGVLGRLFGPDRVRTFARLRREDGRRAAAYVRSLWGELADPAGSVDELVREQYDLLFGALDAPTYATPGNVDSPRLWPEYARDGLVMLDGQSVDLGGLRFGFAGGAVLPPGVPPLTGPAPWRAYLRTPEDFALALDSLGEVDVWCTHVPPALDELCYDVVARRVEVGSEGLLDRIRAQRARWALFGHVHQPLSARARVGVTDCVNVGHFQRTASPYVLHW
ncbi:metallophosphoesterase family protein [Actinoalloteichus caeruleus]|uniref:metallophosphoesterase family protein n=1 Tax=Actinoalloteichus cyanogriseus TaxID=2893586 RepID=UPI0004AA19B7|nr:metallophosphoesterase [Actinoalloteichus caeruleus]